MSKTMIIVLAGGLLLASPAPAAETADSSERLVKEMAALNESMREAVALLKKNLETQRMQLMMRRIELRHAEMTGIEEELRKSRDERQSAAEEIEQLESSLGALDQRIDEESGPKQGSEWRMMRGEMEIRMKMLKDRLYRIDQKIIDLENELGDRRDEIERWEEVIDAAIEPAGH